MKVVEGGGFRVEERVGVLISRMMNSGWGFVCFRFVVVESIFYRFLLRFLFDYSIIYLVSIWRYRLCIVVSCYGRVGVGG